MNNYMEQSTATSPYNMFLETLLRGRPALTACITGNEGYENLRGIAEFYAVPFGGVIVSTEVHGLPASDFYGMHIHEAGDCTIPFDKTGNHYNPGNVEHPNHAGDMPSLLGNNGYAWTVFYDARFTLDDIMEKSVVIHSMRDDFTSQPAGDSGAKLGCGVIMRCCG